MKKRILLVISLILVLTIAICGCNSQPETANNSSLEETHISSLDIESNNNITGKEDEEASDDSLDTETQTSKPTTSKTKNSKISKSSSSKKQSSKKTVTSKPNSSKISSIKENNTSKSLSSKKQPSVKPVTSKTKNSKISKSSSSKKQSSEKPATSKPNSSKISSIKENNTSKKQPSEKPVISKPNGSKISTIQGGISNNTSSKKDNEPSSSSSEKPDISSNTDKTDTRTVNLTKGIAPSSVSGKEADNIFINAQANFAINLFKQTANNDKNKNILISPLSAELVLAMAFNGANGETKKEFENVMGGITIEQLNQYLYSYINSLDDSEIKLNIANSIWVKNGLPVKEEFLKTNKDYYNSEIFGAEFDSDTIDDINKWASDNTDNMIEELFKKCDIDKSTMMCLINALLFDADWEWKYSRSYATQTFTNINGEEKKPQTLRCYAYDYYDDGKATGFKKDYVGNNFSFVALLPNEDVNINDYINGLTGEELLNTLNNPKEVKINTQMPEFTYECDYKMIPSFSNLGITSAFDSNKADFSKISNSLYISNFIQKTKISVNEVGTKAAAVSAATMTKSGIQSQEHKVIIDRPFVYMIIDNKTNLPIFIGTVMDVE